MRNIRTGWGAFGGLIVPASPPTVIHRDLIARLAAQHRLPTVYNERMFVVADGLMSYGPDQIDQFRHAAGYVDRVLKGEKPADLPVQAPTNYKLLINRKASEAGQTVAAGCSIQKDSGLPQGLWSRLIRSPRRRARAG
jgi:ABC-type uncharacterized transport system substrate-binding protein